MFIIKWRFKRNKKIYFAGYRLHSFLKLKKKTQFFRFVSICKIR